MTRPSSWRRARKSRREAGRAEAPPASADPLAWSTHLEAAALICRGATCPTAAKISLFVGTILTATNQGAALMAGDLSAATWARVAVNYAVPFLVSSFGYLAPLRKTTTEAAAAQVSQRGGTVDQ